MTKFSKISMLCTLLSFGLLFACQQQNSGENLSEPAFDEDYYSEQEAEQTAPDQQPQHSKAQIETTPDTKPAPEEPTTIERQLIKNGNVNFEVDDLAETRQNILKLAKRYKAYVASDETRKDYDREIYNMVLRIPAKNFDTLLAELSKGVKHFDYKNISTQDVTEEFLDVQARLKTKKELETRYLQILQKATTVSNMLEIERELNNVRTEIEATEGRLKYLKNQVAFSTLSVEFYKETPGEGNSFTKRIGRGFGNGWRGFLTFLVGLVTLWPFLLLFAAGVWGFRTWRSKRRQS